MARAFARLIGLVAVASATPAAAANWTITGQFSQRLVADTNLGFQGGSGGAPDLASTTDVGLAVTAATRTTTWRFAPGARATLSSDGTFGPDKIRPRFNGSVVHTRPRLTVNGQASFIPEIASLRGLEEGDPDIPEDDEFVTRQGLQYTARGSVGMQYALTPLSSLNLSAFGRLRDDIGGGDLGQTLSYGASAGLSRRLSALTTAQLSGSVTEFVREDGVDSRSYSATAGFSTSLTPRHSVSVSLGPSYTERETGGSSLSATGSLGGTYRTSGATYSLGLSQNVAQGADGSLSNRLSLNAGASWDINAVSRVSLTARAGFDNPLFEDADDRRTFSLGGRYTHRLDQDWSMSVGFSVRAQSAANDTISNAAFISVSRGFDILR